VLMTFPELLMMVITSGILSVSDLYGASTVRSLWVWLGSGALPCRGRSAVLDPASALFRVLSVQSASP
jgi:hypothetical protein